MALTTLSPDVIANAVVSAVLVGVVLVLRAGFGFALRQRYGRTDVLRRRLRVILQNVLTVMLLVGLAFIWSPQLSAFALSLTAFAVALVFAFREFLMCIIGALYRAAARPFALGDWIEVHGVRGEVIDEGLFAFRVRLISEVDGVYALTGRLASVPNSTLLTQTVINETYRKNIVRHAFSIVLREDAQVAAAVRVARDAARSASEPHQELVARFYALVSRRAAIEPPSSEPGVAVRTTDTGLVRLYVWLVCPPDMASVAQSEVTQRVLDEAYAGSAHPGLSVL